MYPNFVSKRLDLMIVSSFFFLSADFSHYSLFVILSVFDGICGGTAAIQCKDPILSNQKKMLLLTLPSLVFHTQAMAEDDQASGLDPGRVDAVINVKLTRTEFAEALGMQPSSIFVRNIFLLADTNNDGFVSFHEFLGLFGVFLKGEGHFLWFS